MNYVTQFGVMQKKISKEKTKKPKRNPRYNRNKENKAFEIEIRNYLV